MYNYDEQRELNDTERLQVYLSCGFIWVTVFSIVFLVVFGVLISGGLGLALCLLGLMIFIGLTVGAIITLMKFGVH